MTVSSAFTLALQRIAQAGISNADPSDVVAVARALWETDELPDVSEIDGAYRLDALFLLNRLAQFNCVPCDRKLVILSMLQDDCRDGSELNRFLPLLLPLQTRHYIAKIGR